MSLLCMICGGGLQTVGALERVNDKGKPGLWACLPHYESARAYFPDDDPRAPPPPRLVDDWDTRPRGPWTGGVTLATPPAKERRHDD